MNFQSTIFYRIPFLIKDFIRLRLRGVYFVPLFYLYSKCLGRLDPEVSFLLRGSDSGTTFIDVGANSGLYAYAASRRGYRVFCFEPIPVFATRLSEWAARTGRVTVFNIALGRTEGRAKLFVPIDENKVAHFAAASLHFKAGASFDCLDVELRTLDSFDVGYPSLIKIDVEGYELEVLAGAQATIRRFKPILIIEIENRHNKHFSLVLDFLDREGYLAHYISANKIRPIGFLELSLFILNPLDESGRYVSNFTFVHRSELARRKGYAF